MQPNKTIPDAPVRIVLIGFMGAGKSTTGSILAKRLGWHFVDADQQLEQRTGSTVAALFSNLGETEFRRIEAEVVAELHREHELVLALGGGAVEAESTRRLLAESSETCVIFLKAPLEVLIDRCEQQPDAAIRPVLNQRAALHERFHSRQQYYETAHITIETHGVSPSAVVDLILDKLQASSFALPLWMKAGTI
jgi:shikimate kinase